MNMMRKVFNYEVSVDWEKEYQGFLNGDFDKIQVACPKEFNGPGGIVTPEDMFVAANAICIMTTFLDFIGKTKIKLISYKSNAVGSMEFIDGFFRISQIVIKVKIQVDEQKNVERTERLLRKACDICPIGKSSISDIVLEPEILSRD